MDNHLRVESLEAAFIRDEASTSLALAIRSLTLALSRQGLSIAISALIPDEPLEAQVVEDTDRGGCTIQLQATRLGFRARILIHLKPASDTPGSILINVDPYNRWAPLDRIMREIALTNLQKQASTQPGIQKRTNSEYQLDLQSIIRDRLLDSSAPVRWDARLDRIDATRDEIRVQFVSMVQSQ